MHRNLSEVTLEEIYKYYKTKYYKNNKSHADAIRGLETFLPIDESKVNLYVFKVRMIDVEDKSRFIHVLSKVILNAQGKIDNDFSPFKKKGQNFVEEHDQEILRRRAEEQKKELEEARRQKELKRQEELQKKFEKKMLKLKAKEDRAIQQKNDEDNEEEPESKKIVNTVIPKKKVEKKAEKKTSIIIPEDVGSEEENTVLFDEEHENEAPSKILSHVISVSIVLGIVLGTMLVGFWGANFSLRLVTKQGLEVDVPDIKMKNFDVARKELKGLGLYVQEKKRVHDNDIPKGKIISQSPDVGMKTKKNRSIEVIVSNGPEMVYVPHLDNISLSQAKLRLKNADLYPGKVNYRYSDEVKKNKVIYSSPQAVTPVPRKSKIDLVISSGKLPQTDGKKSQHWEILNEAIDE